MLQAMGVPQPRTVFAHGWWLVDDQRMSKTTGNVVDPKAFSDKYGVDAFRYYLMAEMTLGNDANFSELGFAERYNNDLADGLGNMLSRVVKMIHKQCGGKLPVPGEPTALEVELRDACLAAVAELEQAVPALKLDRGLQRVAEVVRLCNRYFERTAPWQLVKSGDTARLHTVLYSAAEALRIVGGLLYPVLPGKMGQLLATLGQGEAAPALASLRQWGVLLPGTAIADPPALFPKLDLAALKADLPSAPPAALAPAAAPAPAEPVAEMIEIGDFSKVKLRTAKVLQAERVPKADRLLRLQLDVGGVPRQIVAGIAQHYTPEQVVGKSIVIVANLKPAVIKGETSNGMLLAAKIGKELRLITVDGEIASGASVG
jgi:methionyl-tRNA synthetase